MVIETSALVAIVFEEPEGPYFEDLISQAGIKIVSAASVLEASIVVERRRGQRARDGLDRALAQSQAQIVPVTVEQIEIARDAYRKYGRGRHKAGLNFGDCFSYALAKVSGEPLLYKGNDFALTDLATSPPPSPQNK